MASWSDGLTPAGIVVPHALDVYPPEPPLGRVRHDYGDGPFVRYVAYAAFAGQPGLYVRCASGQPVDVGQTRGTLRSRLGPNGYSTISPYNTSARQPGRTNGGQQTNCRVNALANAA